MRRTMGRGARMGLALAVAAACVALDQWAKALALDHLVPGRPVTFVPGVMDLLLVRNTGAAFSIGEGAGWVFVLVCLVVCAVVTVALWRTRDVPTSLVVCAGLVVGGGVGNLIDRVARGWVCDFFATTFVDFAVFNVADIFVCVGVGLGIVLTLAWDARRVREAGARDAGAARSVARRGTEGTGGGSAADRLRGKGGGRRG